MMMPSHFEAECTLLAEDGLFDFLGSRSRASLTVQPPTAKRGLHYAYNPNIYPLRLGCHAITKEPTQRGISRLFRLEHSLNDVAFSVSCMYCGCWENIMKHTSH